MFKLTNLRLPKALLLLLVSASWFLAFYSRRPVAARTVEPTLAERVLRAMDDMVASGLFSVRANSDDYDVWYEVLVQCVVDILIKANLIPCVQI